MQISLDVFYFIGNLFLVGQYFTKRMIVLRVIAIIGSLFFILGTIYTMLKIEGSTTTLIFMSITFLINIYYIILKILDERKVSIPKSPVYLKKTYEKKFTQLPTRSYLNIINLGEIKTYNSGEIIIAKNSKSDLSLILEGSVDIKLEDKVVTGLEEGHFIGAFSYIANIKSTTDIYATKESIVISWNRKTLDGYHNKNPDIFNQFDNIINKDIIDIVLKNNYEKIAT